VVQGTLTVQEGHPGWYVCAFVMSWLLKKVAPGVVALRFHYADALQSALDAILKVTL
jgi:hypothetical protein